MMNIHSLTEYGVAKQVVQDVPPLIRILDKYYQELSPYVYYRDINNILYQISESMIMLQMHYESYKKIYETKGKING